MSINYDDHRKKLKAAMDKFAAARRAGKITRDAFLYMEPFDENHEFAECRTCVNFNKGTCSLFSTGTKVNPTNSCGLYVNGVPGTGIPDIGTMRVKPSDVGFVRTKPRCENCVFFNAAQGKCELFDTLNAKMPETFSLNTKVKPTGCCNAFETGSGKDEEKEMEKLKGGESSV